MEYSSKWNTHIVKRNSSNGTPHQGTLHLWLLLPWLLVDLGGRPILQYLALVFPFLVFRSNGTLIICMPWIIIKKYIFTINARLFFDSRITPTPQIGLWTLRPRFLQRFYSPLSPRSIFQTAQRFLLQNHVTSGCMSPRSIFQTAQRFPLQTTWLLVVWAREPFFLLVSGFPS